jgi:hypothetical protein
MKIYVASSWRNDYQPDVVRGLRELGHEVYDFRHPAHEGPDAGCAGHLADGFHWSEINGGWKTWTVEQFVSALDHPLAVRGFRSDFDAMKWADACVLVAPCGRSAHLEAGYFVGACKPLLILADGGEPELMYKMADGVFGGLGLLLIRLQEIEDATLGGIQG